jgi:hypothetical protein
MARAGEVAVVRIDTRTEAASLADLVNLVDSDLAEEVGEEGVVEGATVVVDVDVEVEVDVEVATVAVADVGDGVVVK